MSLRCPTCQRTSPAEARFCSHCGSRLETRTEETMGGLTQAADFGATVRMTPDLGATIPPPGFLPRPPVATPPSPPPVAVAEPQDARALAVPDPGLAAAADASGASVSVVPAEPRLLLRVNFNHLLIEGHPTTFQVEVENTDAVGVEHVSLGLFSSALGLPVELNLGRLAPGQSVRRNVEIEPRRAGAMVLTFALAHRRGDDDCQQRGETVLRVLREPERKDNIQVTIRDLVNFSGTNAGLGAELDKLDLGSLLEGKIFRDFNALVEHPLPDDFVSVALELDYAISRKVFPARIATLTLPPAFLQTYESAAVLRLVPVSTGPAEVRVVARPEFLFGRSGSEVDFLAWFWPRSEVNDEATRRISKVHLSAEVREGRIWLEDLASTNGSYLDGEKLPPDQPGAFSERGLLQIGLEYRLEVRHDPGAGRGGPAVGNLARWAGASAADSDLGMRGAVRFQPRSCEGAPRTALWLFTDASFGRSRSNALSLDLTGLAEVQGRLHYWKRSFLLEQGQGDGAVAVDGHVLAAGEVVPLKSGQRVRLGAAVYRVTLQ